MGRVRFGGFVILWLKPNPTRYKIFFVTQPNPPSPKNRPNPSGWVGSGRVWRVGGFSAHPYNWQPSFDHLFLHLPPTQAIGTLLPFIFFFFLPPLLTLAPCHQPTLTHLAPSSLWPISPSPTHLGLSSLFGCHQFLQSLLADLQVVIFVFFIM